ncbi:DNA-binding response regulator [Candidatus Amesbacteria bacterium RIFCSPHIGHO2_01_FULL_48_32]|uniref:DNA-binding response regulator n=1 Tax=Candidatus Amesbacteria bacterium RIFCSPLOWO2_01_FULL_48_25 TaxID=1797259 RepID=A0A1F4ZBH4_9BACT|nr:MAG: DNA-binding response regulator [Candidatus Amesbacteria bacterium RIFCSPHIGHO2_01_FULL_48_32]OGD03227.1 MAG: DNA-binding response regulator [Candidatus Amesbacteria bacterium RIFCSPLOWO2_01_FULL_48_25]HJZ05171.1 response regulator transcription factor [Patescibacteria group bacterium]
MRVLLVEDEHRLSDVIKKGLEENGFAVDAAFDGEEGLFLAQSEDYDLIILDIMLPKMDGLEVCRRLRNRNLNIPILLLTAKSQVEDKVAGLDSGADDYLTKPFAFLELRSRIQALLRRSRQEASPLLTLSNLQLDPIRHQTVRAGRKVELTPKEFAVLEFLLRHKNEVVTRTMITEHVWDYNFEGMSNVVDVFVAAIRRKIDKNSAVKLIHTIHGVGYKAGVETLVVSEVEP